MIRHGLDRSDVEARALFGDLLFLCTESFFPNSFFRILLSEMDDEVGAIAKSEALTRQARSHAHDTLR